MREFKLAGNSHEEKLTHAETILRRMSRRLHKHHAVVVPPIPISQYAKLPDDEMVVMRFMFPAAGQVTKACIYINKLPTDTKNRELKTTSISVHIYGAELDTVKNITVRNQPIVVDINQSVTAGTRVEVKVPDGCSNIWTAFLYEITQSENKVHNVLIDELEKLEQASLEG